MSRIFGLTGPNAAGKGEVASFLGACGFRVHSLSDVVREAAAAEGLPPEREHLIRIGTRLRREGGSGILAERIVARLGERDVVDSIRNPAEVDVLRRLPSFVLLGIDAPIEMRFRRSLARARPGDPATLEAFRMREAQENTDDPAAQRLRATFGLADHVIMNGSTLEALHDRVRAVLRALGDL